MSVDADHRLPTRDASGGGELSYAPRRQSRARFAGRVVFVVLTGLAGALLGLVCLTAAFVLQLGSPLKGGHFASSFRPYFPVVVWAAVTRSVICMAGRPHRNRRTRGYADEIVEGIREALVGSLVIVVFTFFWRGGVTYHAFSYARSVFVLDLMLSTFALVDFMLLTKMALERLRARGFNRRSVIVVGSARTAASFSQDLVAHPEIGYEVIAQIDSGEDGDFVDTVNALAAEFWVDEVILATPEVDRADIARLVSSPPLRETQVRAIPELFGLPPTKVRLEATGDFPLLSLLHEPLSGARRGIKRGLDLVLAALVAVVALPVVAVAWVAVRLTSPGPAFFTQDRIGMDGRPFRIVKLRTMRVDADSSVHEEFVLDLIRGATVEDRGTAKLYKIERDPRITPVGRIFRRCSIDELPQLFNVFAGDMSLVGPRPAIGYEVAAYDEWHRRRLEVRPGMTGLWQVSGRNRLTFDDMVKLDIHYIETWSPVSDLSIMLRTIPALLRRDAS